MADARPTIAPLLLAELVEAAPGRLVRKLDKKPELAEGWSWRREAAATVVTTDKGERVRLEAASIKNADQIACTCLLSPRCLHILAVARILTLSEDAPQEDETAEDGLEGPPLSPVTQAQREGARALFEASAALLVRGLRSSGAVAQADLLRAVHGGRAQGLHRAAMAGLRLVQHARQLRSADGAFDLDAAASDLHEALWLTHRLGREERAGLDLLGQARRRYLPIDTRKWVGLCSEAVSTRSGFVGVVTYLVDDDGGLWTLPQIGPSGTPGLADTPGGAYASSIDMGSCVASHETVCRGGLLVSGATGSADRRLGRGAGVRAVPTDRDGAEGWALLESAGRRIEPGRPCVVEGIILGAYRDALVLRLGGGVTLPILPAFDDPQLPERHNLRVLARGPGTPVRAVVIPLATRGPAARLLAVRSDALRLPEAWKGLVNITLDKIESNVLAEPLARPHLLQAPSPAADPLYIPQRRLTRAVMGGVRTLAQGSAETDREAAGLAASMMPRGAALMAALAAAAVSGGQDLQGRQRPPNPGDFARAWLACSAWTRSASQAARGQGWSP